MRCSALTVALGGVIYALPPAWAAERWVPSAPPAVTIQRDDDAEDWALDRVLAGAPVNFDERCGSVDNQTARDDASWRDPCRTMAAEFVVRILTAEPWRSSLPDRGLLVRGASLTGELHLGGAHVASDVQLERCRFEGKAYLDRARLDGMLSLDKSTLEQGLFAPAMRVGGDFYLRDATVRGQVDLVRASVGGELGMDGTTIDDGFSVASVRVGGGLYLRDVKVHGPLTLRATLVGDNLELDRASFGGGVEANSLRVRGGLFLRGAVFDTVPEIILAHIGLTLDISGAALPGLDLSGTTVAEDLRLGSA